MRKTKVISIAMEQLQRRLRLPSLTRSGKSIAAPPGTISVPEGLPPPRLHLIRYDETHLVERDLDSLSDLEDAEGVGPQAVTWLNIDGIGDAALFEELGTRFALHTLALEDVVTLNQRPKLEEYEDLIYAVLRMPNAGSLEQVSLFITKQTVITIQERTGDCFEPVRERIRKGRHRIRSSRADYLAYAVIDGIIDNFFPLVEAFNDRLEDVESRIIQESDQTSMAEIHATRSELYSIRRVLLPTSEAIHALVRQDMAAITPTTRIYLRDCLDHAARLLDSIEACRDLSSNLLDLHLAGMSQRMNEIMKVLTLIATIFIPLGFIAGLYGMNFDPHASAYNMPELNWTFGYPFAIGLMVATALGFLVYFRHRGWLGGKPPLPAKRQNDPR